MSLLERLKLSSMPRLAQRLVGYEVPPMPRPEPPAPPDLGMDSKELLADGEALHKNKVPLKDRLALLPSIKESNPKFNVDMATELLTKQHNDLNNIKVIDSMPQGSLKVIDQKDNRKIRVIDDQPKYEIKNRAVKLSNDDIEEAKKVMFAEVSNRPPDKQDLEVRVILNTAINRMKENEAVGKAKTLTQILQEPNQYQGYQNKQYKKLVNDELDDLSKEKKAKINALVEKYLKSEKFDDNTNNAFYYIHNKDESISYDDEKSLFENRPKKKNKL